MSAPGLALRVSQQLSLTPQLQQSIRLLQLSTLELEQEIGQMLADNPFLEQEDEDQHAPGPGSEPGSTEPAGGEEAAAPQEAPDAAELPDSAEALPWEGEGETGDSDWGQDAPGRAGGGEDEADAQDLASSHETLAAHLARQALALRLSPEDGAALALLIGSLNDDGYLEDSLAQLADALLGDEADGARQEELMHRLTMALGLLQSLEPSGVGARDLGECLALQLRARQQAGQDAPELTQVALAVCRQPLQWLARRDVRRLAQACAASEELTRASIALIARLEPKPGRRFADVRRLAVVPDVIVQRSGLGARQRLAVQLNPAVMPRLRVHELYAGALRAQRGRREGHAQLQARLQEARWFIKNVQQRFDTILRVSDAIVRRQKSFFTHGELAMRPLVLRDIAEELGLHESTISRVTTAKYMATPQGTYELKYFFGSGLGTETGGNASSTAVRALIRQFVAAEDPAKPLSDSKIADLLKEQGIECARRTVAKYREALRIAPANLRKTL